MTLDSIPLINSYLNGAATVLIVLGLTMIKRGNKQTHGAIMLAAGAVSALFLIGYVSHKVLKHGVHTPFGGDGAIAYFYYAMLISHIILAISIAFLVPRTFYLALNGEYEKHKRWARFTYPIWLYVSITGVLVYLFLYQWWPHAQAI